MGYNAAGNIQYGYAQLEGIWIQAGGPPGAAAIAAAIAMAESGGNSTATNQDSNGTVDRGLWQINSVHGDAQSTYDVMGNARAAVAISNRGTNWTPWTVFNTGIYSRYLQGNIPPDTSAPINGTNAQANNSTANLTGITIPGIGQIPGINAPGGCWDPFNWQTCAQNAIGGAAGGAAKDIAGSIVTSTIKSIISALFNPVINLAAGVMGITAGGVMVLFGIFMIVKGSETGQTIGRTAMWAAETGASAVAPETEAATVYKSGEDVTATVKQTRRQAGRVRVGGRSFQYRPGTVRTDVQRPPSTKDQLVKEANSYGNGNGLAGTESERTTGLRPYGRGVRMGPPRPVQGSGRSKK